MLFDTAEIPWWAWVRRFHLPEVGARRSYVPAREGAVGSKDWHKRRHASAIGEQPPLPGRC